LLAIYLVGTDCCLSLRRQQPCRQAPGRGLFWHRMFSGVEEDHIVAVQQAGIAFDQHGQAALMFLLLGFETKGRSIEEINRVLDTPARVAVDPVRVPAQ
jgi:hypothetical protein